MASTRAPSHAPSGPVRPGRLRTRLAAAAGCVAVVVVLDSSGIVSPGAEVVVDNAAQFPAEAGYAHAR